MERDYTANIIFTTATNLTVKDKIQIKNFSAAAILNDSFADNEMFDIKVDRISLVDVHNEKAKDDKDYTVCVIESGEKTYRTSSQSFIEAIQDIDRELLDSGESISDYTLRCFKIKSKNNTGYILQATLA